MLKVKAENIGDLYLHPTPFAKGGEGELYEVKAPKAYQQQVVKLYYPEKRTRERAAKIEYLIAQPPAFVQADLQQLAWPAAKIEFEGQFAGFMMPKVAGEPLEILCTAKLPKKINSDWQRFGFENTEAIRLRQKVCYNLAVALQRIHASRQYAVVDLKPENILIQPNGIVSIVDLDSIEVFEEDSLKFSAPVATAEFSPPEFFNTKEAWATGRECWDRFSMAVIFYKLLTGIHPFAATAKAPYEGADSLAAKIENGLFVHQPTVRPFLTKVPPLHQRFFQLPIELQDAFMQSFAFGAEHTDMRTTASEWCWALAAKIEELKERPEALKPFIADFPAMDLPQAPLSLPTTQERQRLFIEQLKQLKSSKKLSRSWWQRPPTKKRNISNLAPKLLKSLQKIGLNVRWQMFWASKFSDWQIVQKEQEAVLNQLHIAAEQNYKQQKSLFTEQLRELNRSLAHFAQKHRLKKYKAYQELQENPLWEKYRGNNLEAKIWHLNNQAAEAALQLKAKRQKAFEYLEQQQHAVLSKLETAYYKQLKKLEDNAKTDRASLNDNLENYYQRSKIKEEQLFNKSREQKHGKSLDLLQDQYFNQIKLLEKEQQKRLAELTEMLRAKGKVALVEFKSAKRAVEESLRKKRLELEKAYRLKKERVLEKAQVLTKTEDKDIQSEEEQRKRWRAKQFNQIQQNLQQTKAEAERHFIHKRQEISSDLQKGKEELLLEEEKANYDLTQKSKQEEELLKKCWKNYQEKLKEEDSIFWESQQDLNEELECIKERFQLRLSFYHKELAKQQQEIVIELEQNWNQLFTLK